MKPMLNETFGSGEFFAVPSMSPGGTEGTLMALVYVLEDNNSQEKLSHKICCGLTVRLQKK